MDLEGKLLWQKKLYIFLKRLSVVTFLTATFFFGTAFSAYSATTTLATGSDLSNITIAPGATATSTSAFTFQTDTGTDIITAITLNISNASATSMLEITNDAGTVVYGSSTNPTGATTTTITLVPFTLTANTSLTQYKIRITPKSQANMGTTATTSMLYPVTTSIRSWTGTNTNKLGSDTASSSIIIDNQAPATTGNSGITWATSTSAVDINWRSVAYGNGLFVAVSDSGTGNRVMTSTDGITWTSRTSAADNVWVSITYGNGLFVAVSSTSSLQTVMTSPDGISWTLRTGIATIDTWYAVTYGNGLFVAVACGTACGSSANRTMTSTDGITWTAGTSAEDNQWASVTYGNGLFVATAYSGTNRAMTSPDGINWTVRTSITETWTSVTYGNGLFVAVTSSCGSNCVMTSPDGITWTGRTAPTNLQWYGVTYGNGLFVAVAQSGTGNRVMTSPDGITWTSRTSAADNSWFSVTYANGVFVAVSNTGTGNRAMRSTSTLPTVSAGVLQATTTYLTPSDPDLAGMILLSSSTAITTIPVDGTTYSVGNTINGATVSCIDTSVTASTTDSCVATGLAAGTRHFKLFSYDTNGNYSTGLVPSGSPATILSATTTVTTGIDLPDITIAPGATATSVNAFTFQTNGGTDVITAVTLNISNASATSMLEITNDAGTIVYGSSTNPTGASTTAITLNNATLTASTTLIQYKIRVTPKSQANMGSTAITSMLYSVFASIKTWTGTNNATGTDTATSSVTIDNEAPATVGSDGATAALWSTATNPLSPNEFMSIAYGNGLFVAVSCSVSLSGACNTTAGNRIVSSPNGITWTSRAGGASISWRDITYGNGLFVAVSMSGSNNQVMTSPDGVTWTSRTTTNNTWYSVTYGNGVFVASASTSSSQNIMTSPDGITWTSRSSGINNYWNAVAYGNGLFVAVSDNFSGNINNRIMTSPDGITWTARTAAANIDLYNVYYGNGLFVAVDNDIASVTNRVMTSPDGIIWTSYSVPVNRALIDVTYGNGRFVIVNNRNGPAERMVSTDGSTWTAASSSISSLAGVAYGNGRFVGVNIFSQIEYSSTTNPTLTSGVGQATTTYVTPGGSDISGMILLSSSTAITTVPVDGTTYNIGNTINGATVACIDTQVTTLATDSCVATGLSAGTLHFKLFSYDTNGNYSTGLVPSGSPATIPSATTTVATGVDLPDITIGPGATATSVNAFTFQTNGGTDVITAVTLNISNASATSMLEITNDAGTIVYGSSTNPTGATTTSITLNNATLTASTTLIQYKIRVTPKSQANLPIGFTGMLYPVTTSVLSWTGTNTSKSGTDLASSSVIIDNEPPATTVNTGVTWVSRSSPTDNTNTSITYGNGAFVALAQNGAGGSRIMRSSDGITWATSSDTNLTHSWKSVVFGNGLFVAVACGDITSSCNTTSGNRVMRSVDGITWATSTGAVSTQEWLSVTYGKGIFVAVGCGTACGSSTSNVMTSSDGIAWTTRTSAADNLWRSVAYGNGIFVAVASSGSGNRVQTSLDGVNWTTQSSADNAWLSVTYGNGLFVAVACGVSSTSCNTTTGNSIMTSPDGITWTPRTPAANYSWWSVTYGNGLFVSTTGTSTTNSVQTSPDGTNWTLRTGTTTADWIAVTYAHGTFAAVSQGGTGYRIMTSTSTLPTATAGDTQATVSYITPRDSDLTSMIVLRATSTITAVPVDGTIYTGGETIGAATVACVDTTVTASTSDSCIATGLTNGSSTYLKLFALDSSGNYSAGLVPVGSPVVATSSATSTPVIQIDSYRYRRDDAGETNASFYTSESNPLITGFIVGDSTRLRFVVSNQGSATSSLTYRLEYASSSCTTWYTVPLFSAAANSAFKMDTSYYVYDAQATAHLSGLTPSTGKTFVAGAVQTSSNQTQSISLANNQYTELEYLIRSTPYQSAYTLYCFRVTNAGDATGFTYIATPSLSAYNIVYRRYGGGGTGGGGVTFTEEIGSTGTTTISGGGSGSGGNTGGEATSTATTTTGGGGSRGGGGGDSGFLYHGSNLAKNDSGGGFFSNLFGLLTGTNASNSTIVSKPALSFGEYATRLLFGVGSSANASTDHQTGGGEGDVDSSCPLSFWGVCIAGNIPGMNQ